MQVMEKPIPPSEKTPIASETANAKKEEPIKSEDNVLSQEEIASLEKKEEKIKGGLLGKIFKNSHSSADNKSDDPASKQQFTNNAPETQTERLEKELKAASSRIESVTMSVEKIEGKLESERAVATGIEERMSHLTEEIGELRSMILDRERGFNEIETNFKKIEAMTEEIRPQIIKKDLDRKEREIIDISVKIERLEAISSETNKQIKLFREQMDKIRSLDNLLKVSKDIEENITRIKDTEKYTDRMAAKTEELFTELDKRLAQFVGHTARIESLDELTKDLMKSLDKNEIKLKEAVFKEDLEKLKSAITSSVNENIKKELSGDNSNLGKKLEDACKSAAEAKETASKLATDEKNKDAELTNIKTALKSFESQLKDLKSQYEIQNIETQKKIEIIGISSTGTTPADIRNKNEQLPDVFDMISEKKIKEVRKEIEEISNAMRYLDSSISDLRKNSLSQVNYIRDIKRYLDCLPGAIDNKIIEKTSDLKTSIAMTTELLAQFQKNKIIEKEDIDCLRESLSNLEKIKKLQVTLIDENKATKSNEIESIRKDISILGTKISEEIEQKRKDDEMSRTELEKTLRTESAKVENLNKNIGQISGSVRDLKSIIDAKKHDITERDIPKLFEPVLNRPETTKAHVPESRPEFVWTATESAPIPSHTSFQDTSPSDIIAPDTLKLDEYDLRLNKIIRLIGKTEESLEKNNMEDAKISYGSLKTAYNAVYKKVPKHQIDEIRPKIDRLENLLRKK